MLMCVICAFLPVLTRPHDVYNIYNIYNLYNLYNICKYTNIQLSLMLTGYWHQGKLAPCPAAAFCVHAILLKC